MVLSVSLLMTLAYSKVILHEFLQFWCTCLVVWLQLETRSHPFPAPLETNLGGLLIWQCCFVADTAESLILNLNSGKVKDTLVWSIILFAWYHIGSESKGCVFPPLKIIFFFRWKVRQFFLQVQSELPRLVVLRSIALKQDKRLPHGTVVVVDQLTF